MIEAAAERTERERKIPADVLAAMHDARLFHMLLPLSLGGGAADLVTFNQVIETIAAADASPAWCLAQAAGSSHSAGFLAPEIAREVFGRARCAGGLGTACRHRQGGGGRRRLPRHRQMALRQRQRQRHLDGRAFDRVRAPTTGRGSTRPAGRSTAPCCFASNRPTSRTPGTCSGCAAPRATTTRSAICSCRRPTATWRDFAPHRREQGPLYNIPMLTLYGVGFSGVALGIARACLEAFMTIAQTKRSAGGVGSTGLLRDNAVVQSRLAQATGQLRSARAFLLQMLAEIWESFVDGRHLFARAACASSRRHHRRDEQARKVTDFACHAAGTNAIFQGGPFERRFRDLHTRLGAGPSPPVEFRSRRPGAVRHRARATVVGWVELFARPNTSRTPCS